MFDRHKKPIADLCSHPQHGSLGHGELILRPKTGNGPRWWQLCVTHRATISPVVGENRNSAKRVPGMHPGLTVRHNARVSGHRDALPLVGPAASTGPLGRRGDRPKLALDTPRHSGRSTLVAACALLVVACQGSSASTVPTIQGTPQPTVTVPQVTPPQSASAAAGAWRMVALGDSDTTGSGAPVGKGWVDSYAGLIRAGTGRDVAVSNLAQDGTLSSQLLSSVKGTKSVRDAIAEADIVVVGIGGADLNAGDDALASGSCKGTACYAPVIAGFKTNIDAIAGEIVSIRAGKPTVLRAIGFANGLTGAEDVIPPFLSSIATEVGVYQSRGLSEAVCAAMTAHGGQCVDVLTAFNGPNGDGDAYKTGLMNKVDCCYPSEKGQSLMADLLYATGLAPLESP